MKKRYVEIAKRILVTVLSASMVFTPSISAFAEEQIDVSGVEEASYVEEADADVVAEAVDEEEAVEEISGVEDEVIVETVAAEDAYLLDDEDETTGKVADDYVFDLTQLVKDGKITTGEHTSDETGGSWIKKEVGPFGDDDRFTILAHNSSKTPVENNVDSNAEEKEVVFPDGTPLKVRLNLNGKMDLPLYDEEGVQTNTTTSVYKALRFTTKCDNARVRIWWVEKDGGNDMTIYKDSPEEKYPLIASTNIPGGAAGGQALVSRITIPKAGTYLLGADPYGSSANYIMKMMIRENFVDTVDWSTVEAGTITSVSYNKLTADSSDGKKKAGEPEPGKIDVNFKANINELSAADSAVVYMYDKKIPDEANAAKGLQPYKLIGIKTYELDGTKGSVTFAPDYSSDYIFELHVCRENREDKVSEPVEWTNFKRPLDIPVIEGYANKKGKKVEVSWVKADAITAEESQYKYFYGASIGDGPVTYTKELFTVLDWSALDENQNYNINVTAYRVEMSAEEWATVDVSKYTAADIKKITDTTVSHDDEGKTTVIKNIDVSETAVLSFTALNRDETFWKFSSYGTSTKDYSKSSGAEYNGYRGNANDGEVRVYSVKGSGKIVPNSMDGVSFYYVEVPSDKNFTIQANVHVNNWSYTNGQDGFGVMAADRVGKPGDTDYWNNSFMSVVTKSEYRWDPDAGDYTDDINIPKVNMYLGVSALARYGVTKDNLAEFESTPSTAIKKYFTQDQTALEHFMAQYGGGIYNIINGYCAAHTFNERKKTYPKGALRSGTIVKSDYLFSDFIMKVQRNNTGYFVSYQWPDGTVQTKKYYEPVGKNLLATLDEDSVYAGFFAARNADVTFTPVDENTPFLTVIDPVDDEPREEPENVYFSNNADFLSSSNSNSADYKLTYLANWDGDLVITNDSGKEIYNGRVTADEYVTVDTVLTYGKNNFKALFKADPDYHYGYGYEHGVHDDERESNKLNYLNTWNAETKSYPEKSTSLTVNYRSYGEPDTYLYVSPEGTSNGNGTISNPLDIYTAVKYVMPGQTIMLAGGTYKLNKNIRIERGIDGTADKPIRMIADPDDFADGDRPVFDFMQLAKASGFVIGGNYWYIQGLEIMNTRDQQKGIQVAGSYCTLEDIVAHHNGNNGIDLSRLYSSDTPESGLWPHDNLVLNCSSYENSDAGYEDADGFTCKLTTGDNNVFEGCVAHHNADDGWDLYSKSETGEIGRVIIKNSVAYGNGYITRDTDGDGVVETIDAGNGNGFKMGGESLYGGHTVFNCFSFYNKAKGIDSNSCPDIKAFNCVSYDNESYNLAFYTNNEKATNYNAYNVISFRDEKSRKGVKNEDDTNYSPCTHDVHTAECKYIVGDSGGKYTQAYDKMENWDGRYQLNAALFNPTVFYYEKDAPEVVSRNSNSVTVDKSYFKSLDFNRDTDEVKRDDKGRIQLGDFLQLTDAGAKALGIKVIKMGDANADIKAVLQTEVDNRINTYGAQPYIANPFIYTRVDNYKTIDGKTTWTIDTTQQANGTDPKYIDPSKLVATSGAKEQAKNDSDSSVIQNYPDVESLVQEDEAVIAGIIKDQDYTGLKKTPQLLIYDGSGDTATQLVLNRDFSVTYLNNISAGTATVKLYGKGNYNGKYYIASSKESPYRTVASEVNFKIKPVNLSESYTQRIQNKETEIYENVSVIETENVYSVETSEVESAPVPKVAFNNGKSVKNLKAKTDYTVEYYYNNNKVYTEDEVLEPSEAVKATQVESIDDTGLDGTKTYTIVLRGTYNETVSGKNLGGNFAGVRCIPYTIYDASKVTSIKDAEIPAIDPQILEATKKGNRPFELLDARADSTQKYRYEIKVGDKVLEPGVDFTVKYSNNKKKGVAIAKISGIGAYGGSTTVKFKIVKARIAQGNTVSDNFAATIEPGLHWKIEGKGDAIWYTGEAITFNNQLRVYYTAAQNNGSTEPKLLRLGKDYKVVYVGAKNAGSASAQIIGVGSYTGRYNLKYNIRPLPASDLINKGTIKLELNGYKATSLNGEPVDYVKFQKKNGKINVTLSYVNPNTGNTVYFKQGKDYKLTYYNNEVISEIDSPKSNVQVSFKQGLQGVQQDRKYAVRPGVFDDTSVVLTAADIKYSSANTKLRSKPVVMEYATKKKLGPNKDYNKTLNYYYLDKNGNKVELNDGDIVPNPADEEIFGAGNNGYDIIVTANSIEPYYEAGSISSTIHVSGIDIRKATVVKLDRVAFAPWTGTTKNGVELNADAFFEKNSNGYYLDQNGKIIKTPSGQKVKSVQTDLITVYNNYTRSSASTAPAKAEQYKKLISSLKSKVYVVDKASKTKTYLIYGFDFKIASTPDVSNPGYSIPIYKNNTRVGKAAVTIQGIGAYTGVKTVPFEIIPKGMMDNKISSEVLGGVNDTLDVLTDGKVYYVEPTVVDENDKTKGVTDETLLEKAVDDVITIGVGNKVTIDTVDFYDADTIELDKTSFASADSAVAAVSSKGVIEAKGEGVTYVQYALTETSIKSQKTNEDGTVETEYNDPVTYFRKIQINVIQPSVKAVKDVQDASDLAATVQSGKTFELALNVPLNAEVDYTAIVNEDQIADLVVEPSEYVKDKDGMDTAQPTAFHITGTAKTPGTAKVSVTVNGTVYTVEIAVEE